MNIQRRWAYVRRIISPSFLALMFIGLSLALPADAQTELPTSVFPSEGSWDRMVPSSFEGTVKDLLRQCNRNASSSTTDSLTSEKCELLGKQVRSNQCRIEYVPDDDISFDILNGRKNGVSHQWFKMKKNLGRRDRAVVCDLGNGVHSYWFTGIPNQSCNNLAFVLLPSQKTTSFTCRRVWFSDPLNYEVFHYNDGVLLESCDHNHYVPSNMFYSSSNIKSNGYTEICE